MFYKQEKPTKQQAKLIKKVENVKKREICDENSLENTYNRLVFPAVCVRFAKNKH